MNKKTLLLKDEFRSSCCFFVIVSLLLLLIVVVILLIRKWIISAHRIHTTTRNERWIFLRLLLLYAASVVWTSHLEIKRHIHYFSLIGQWWWNEKDKGERDGEKRTLIQGCARLPSLCVVDVQHSLLTLFFSIHVFM
jgi:hypothetical protein